MVVAYLYIRIAVKSELKIARDNGIIDYPNGKGLIDYLAVIGVELSGGVVALGRHNKLLYLVIHPTLGESLGHEREYLAALIVRHDIRKNYIERVIELTRGGVLRALDKSHNDRALSRGSADIALVVNVTDTAVNQSLVTAELDGVAGAYLGDFSSGAVNIIRLIRLDRNIDSAERIDKLREALEIDADIVVDLYFIVVLKRLYKCCGAAPEIGVVRLAAALGAVDVHIGIAVSEERHESYRLGLSVEREQNNRIRASAGGLAGLAVNAEKQNIDYVLARILRAAVLSPSGYEAVDIRSVADIVHGVKLLLGRKGALGVAVAAVVDGNQPELLADKDSADDYRQCEHYAYNGYRNLQIAFTVVHKKLFECSFFFLFHKATLFQQYAVYFITFRVKNLY